jgi:hypothetical protein
LRFDDELGFKTVSKYEKLAKIHCFRPHGGSLRVGILQPRLQDAPALTFNQISHKIMGNITWIPVSTRQQVDDVAVRSETQACLILKHSTTCSISAMAKYRLEDDWSFRIQQARSVLSSTCSVIAMFLRTSLEKFSVHQRIATNFADSERRVLFRCFSFRYRCPRNQGSALMAHLLLDDSDSLPRSSVTNQGKCCSFRIFVQCITYG